MQLRIGIDASNLDNGGGRTHILNILNSNYVLLQDKFEIHIWGTDNLLNQITASNNIIVHTNKLLNKSLFSRLYWSLFVSKHDFNDKCDILFVPGGIYLSNFKPFVTMSRNMLLFETEQLLHINLKLRVKLILSGLIHKRSIKESSGLIFLSKYAKRFISNVLTLPNNIIVPHGISNKFHFNRKSYGFKNEYPIKLLYVSHLYPYKHFDKVIFAVNILRSKGYNLELNIVGGGDKSHIKHIENLIKQIQGDSDVPFILYHGLIDHVKLVEFYCDADIFVYASTCENMPNILIEAMSSGLPIACSNKEPMTEFLGDSGLYFNAFNPDSVALSIEKYLNSEELRRVKGRSAYNKSLKYSWEVTSKNTFEFIENIYNNVTIQK